jgi:hypothetical protein
LEDKIIGVVVVMTQSVIAIDARFPTLQKTFTMAIIINNHEDDYPLVLPIHDLPPYLENANACLV